MVKKSNLIMLRNQNYGDEVNERESISFDSSSNNRMN